MELQTRARKFSYVRDQHFSIYEQYARKHGINGKELTVMFWLYRKADGVTQETLQKYTFSTKQVIRAIIKKYEERGYVDLTQSVSDKRKKIVKLTKLGQEHFAQILDPIDDLEAQALAQLDDEHYQVLIESLEQITDFLNQQLNGEKIYE